MEVTLEITYPVAGTDVVVTLVTVTDEDGYYSFDNLLLDESFNGDTGDGSAEPTYSISAEVPVGYAATALNEGKSPTNTA